MAILADMVDSAKRFAHWSAVQKKHRDRTVEKKMKASRLRFTGTNLLAVDSSVFFEQVLEDDDLMPVRYFEIGQLACKPVGRIRVNLGGSVGEGYATGFLIAPRILLTNWHVLRDPSWAKSATVTFDAEDDSKGYPKIARVFPLAPEVIFVSDKKLDYCFVAVSQQSTDGIPIESFGYLRLFRQVGKINRNEYATIIQHPRGRQKQIALRNNKVIVYVYDEEYHDENNSYLYYDTDTEHGSSGSPVLSDQWFVVALHRRGVPETKKVSGKLRVLTIDGKFAAADEPEERISYIANEGVRVSKIIASIAAKANSKAGDAASAIAVESALGETAADTTAGPLWVPVSQTVTVTVARGDSDTFDTLEIVRRPLSIYRDATGYNKNFLGAANAIGLPQPSATLLSQIARRIDDPASFILPFNHFSTVMHAARRLPVFAAVNIDGSKKTPGAMPTRPTWSYDPRIAEDHQPDDTIFSSMVQRGHMAARDYIYWGDDASIADRHSFTLTNVCPQIGAFNGNREWSQLERRIITMATSRSLPITAFIGPIFDKSDPLYDSLRGPRSTAVVGTGIRLPNRFWYIIAWIEAGKRRKRCFILDQSDDISGVGQLEIDFEAPATVKETTLTNIEKLTGLTFKDLKTFR
jgi:endonuclease G